MEENSPLQTEALSEPKKIGWKIKLLITALAGIIFVFLLYHFFITPPSDFAPGTVVQVEPGMSLRSISRTLKEDNIIRSRIAFESFVILYGGERQIKFSGYLFERKMSVYEVARWIIKGERYSAPVVATIPEGYNNAEIADLFTLKLISFNRENFLKSAKQGYLFPDTYYFFRTDTEAAVIDSMTKNYEKKVEPLREEIKTSGRSEKQIINMASILEREADGDSDRAIISGILWKRLDRGMRLQVDAAPITYDKGGFPPEPIGNPGLEAIKAAIHPQASSYLYYLHGKDGKTYYARTFNEHKANIAKYLR